MKTKKVVYTNKSIVRILRNKIVEWLRMLRYLIL